MNEEGNEFLESIEDESIRNHPSVANFKDVGSLAKSWVDAQALIGAPKLIDPSKAKPEDWDKTFKALGRPEKAEDYQFDEVKLPEGMSENADLKKEFSGKAHQLGLLPSQVKGLYSWFMDRTAKDLEAVATDSRKSREEAEGALKKEYGANYEANVALAKKAFKAFADEDAVALMEEGLGNDPRFVRLFHKIGKAMSEDNLVGGGGKGAGSAADQARAKINEISADTKHALWDADNPGHKEAVREWTRLHEQAYGK